MTHQHLFVALYVLISFGAGTARSIRQARRTLGPLDLERHEPSLLLWLWRAAVWPISVVFTLGYQLGCWTDCAVGRPRDADYR